jgi:tetratricopeptide (TPR) repeat protein
MTDDSRVEELRRRVQADPASVAFAALAEEYRRMGRFEDAVDVARTGLARHPVYLSARVTLGRALIELNELDQAEAELEQVLKVAPSSLPALRALAEIQHRRGHLPEAIEFYKQAVEVAQRGPLAPEPGPPSPAPAPPPQPAHEPPRAMPEAGPAVPPPPDARVETVASAAGQGSRSRPVLTRLERWLDVIVAERRALDR